MSNNESLHDIVDNAVDNVSSSESDSSSQQFLSFEIAGEDYAVNIRNVVEIKAWSRPTRLPNAPDYILGVMNVRGLVLPIIDLKRKFGLGMIEHGTAKVIIFVKVRNKTIGVLVDAVTDIINFSIDNLQPAPEVHGDIKKEYIEGLIGSNGDMIVLLNIASLLSEDLEKKEVIG